MKDVNVGEKDRTIKKLIEANKTLKEELDREMERYVLLEEKYKDLLVKYNMLAKDHAKNAELLFTATTGAKMGNFNKYLSTTTDVQGLDLDPSQKHRTTDGFTKKFEESY